MPDIKCPNCNYEFALEEALNDELKEAIEKEKQELRQKMTEHLKLPKPLTAQPADVANVIYHGVLKKSNVVYVKWFWRWIMLIITSIPEGIFKKLKL